MGGDESGRRKCAAIVAPVKHGILGALKDFAVHLPFVGLSRCR
jgi:hypothetical protein